MSQNSFAAEVGLDPRPHGCQTKTINHYILTKSVLAFLQGDRGCICTWLEQAKWLKTYSCHEKRKYKVHGFPALVQPGRWVGMQDVKAIPGFQFPTYVRGLCATPRVLSILRGETTWLHGSLRPLSPTSYCALKV